MQYLHMIIIFVQMNRQLQIYCFIFPIESLMPTIARSMSDEASPLDHNIHFEVWFLGSNRSSSTTKESFRSRQMKVYDRARTVQAALPDLFLERLETDDVGDNLKKIVSYEEASKFKQGQSTSKELVSKIISYCRDKSENSAKGGPGRVEHDSENCSMISLQMWKEAVKRCKEVGRDSIDE